MTQTVEDLRTQIDTLDNQLHDLLMDRAELVLKIGEAKRRNNIQVVQPDREIVMLRRLLARHRGSLPKEAVVRIWRELVGAVSLLQTGLRVAVTLPEGGAAIDFWDMAKDYFSSVLPMQRVNNALATLTMVREGQVTLGVVPYPEDGEKSPWWIHLLDEAEKESPIRIVARLPLGDRSNANANPHRPALAVGRLDFNASGDDRTFLALETIKDLSRTRIMERLGGEGLPVRGIVSLPTTSGRGLAFHFVEVDGYVGANDPRLAGVPERLESPEGRCVFIGGYPVPPIYDDRVGKNVG
jgi:chorismate mutase-like protein